MPLVAVKFRLNGLPVADEGEPLSVAVPSPLSLKVSPTGRAPDSARDGVGTPVVVTLKDPKVPAENVAVLPLVIAGACGVPVSVSVSPCWASGDKPLLAVKRMLNGLPASVPGVPPSVAVPFPLSLKVTPAGNAPVSVIEGLGEKPVVITVNEFDWLTMNVPLLALLINALGRSTRNT